MTIIDKADNETELDSAAKVLAFAFERRTNIVVMPAPEEYEPTQEQIDAAADRLRRTL